MSEGYNTWFKNLLFFCQNHFSFSSSPVATNKIPLQADVHIKPAEPDGRSQGNLYANLQEHFNKLFWSATKD